MNRLKNTRGYLCGAMDFSDDYGVGWRVEIREMLNDLGIVWMDPTDKPMHDSTRGKEEVSDMRDLMRQRQYDGVEFGMDDIRFVDLRMVDVSDFVVVYLDMEVHSCGTYEELFRANSQQKPIVVICKQGKDSLPTWLFGSLQHEMMFDSVGDAANYLRHVASSRFYENYGRWLFFSFHGENLDD